LKVLDPFLGIGHSALAAIQTGSDFLGCELDPEYFEVACQVVAEACPTPRAETSAPQEARARQMELF
jgi:DNA modification methylase